MTADIADYSDIRFGWLGYRPDARARTVYSLRPDLMKLGGSAPTGFHGNEQYRVYGRNQVQTNSCVSWATTGATDAIIIPAEHGIDLRSKSDAQVAEARGVPTVALSIVESKRPSVAWIGIVIFSRKNITPNARHTFCIAPSILG